MDKVMKVSVTPGKTYAVTTSEECTITSADGTTIATCVAGEQTVFVAPSSAVDVSSDTAVVVESFRSASTGGKVSRGYIQDAIEEATAGLPQVDASGNMTLEGGLTTAGAINANGGINVPLTAIAAQSVVNRTDAVGLSMLSQALMTPSYVQSTTKYGTPTTTAIAGGICQKIANTTGDPGTVKITYANQLGASDYYNDNTAGAIIRFSPGLDWAGHPIKLSFSVIPAEATILRTQQDIDDFTLSPEADNTSNLVRYYDVTFFTTSMTDASPAGQKIRVREIYRDASSGWKIKTSISTLGGSNIRTVFSIIYSHSGVNNNAALYIAKMRKNSFPILKIADCTPLVGTSGTFIGADVYWDSAKAEGSYVSNIELAIPPDGILAGFHNTLAAIAGNYIQSTTTTDFMPYE